jgi:hypothetical protein
MDLGLPSCISQMTYQTSQTYLAPRKKTQLVATNKNRFRSKKVPKDREKPHHRKITEKSGGSEIHRSLEFHDQFSARTIETRHTMKTPAKLAESESST